MAGWLAPLTTYLNEDAVYRGFDIVEEGITWCQKNITTRHRNFQFIHSDVHNDAYNTTGLHKASEYRFPYDDDSFDLVFLTSVFTHMYPADVENYLSEIARVMRPGATSVITYFLLNDESKGLMVSEKCTLDFAHEISPVCWTARVDTPEDALGFTESYIDGLYESTGLQLSKPKSYGTWCTGRRGEFYQDVVVATKG